MNDFNLTGDDILFAAILAAIITFILNKIMGFIRSVKNYGNMQIRYDSSDIKKALAKCYAMFPKELLVFQGNAYKRGMSVRVTTTQHYTFEGKIIGTNNDNVLCVITPKYIIAHELSHIVTMVKLDDEAV